MHFRYIESHGVATMLSSDPISTVLIGPSYFDQSVTCKIFQDFSWLYIFVGYVRKMFPPEGLKITPPTNSFGGAEALGASTCEDNFKGLQ